MPELKSTVAIHSNERLCFLTEDDQGLLMDMIAEYVNTHRDIAERNLGPSLHGSDISSQQHRHHADLAARAEAILDLISGEDTE